MNEINKKLDKFKMGSFAKSIRNDLSKGKIIFSEESSRAIYEMGKIESIELKQTSATTQRSSCLKHVRIRIAFAALKTPHFRTTDLLQKYKERVERLSQQNRVLKIWTDAGFLTTVEAEQYFMAKDTEEFSQFTEPVTCREHTVPRDEQIIWPKRLDSREHQAWARWICKQRQFSLVGQNF